MSRRLGHPTFNYPAVEEDLAALTDVDALSINQIYLSIWPMRQASGWMKITTYSKRFFCFSLGL